MKKTLCVCLITLPALLTESFGQDIYRTGYIITIQNDTIHGQILSKVDSELASEISFKSSPSATESRTYTTSDLIGFRFDNDRTFERLTFADSNTDSTSVFAKRVLKGRVDLWIMRQSGNDADFFLKNNTNQKVAHLRKEENKTFTRDGKKYVQDNLSHVGLIHYVTDHTSASPVEKKDVKTKYSETNIIGHISKINEESKDKIPNYKYHEEVRHKHDISVGIPFELDPGATEFKLGFFKRKILVEKTRKLSTLWGVTYYGWHKHEGFDGSIENGTSNYRWQLINILPIGLHVQGKRKAVTPYAYVGVGLSVLIISDYEIVDYQNTGSVTSILPYPAPFAAAGFQVRIGSGYFFTEVTPSLWNSTISVGVGF